MKPILVHCHIFYPELWAELKSRLLNIRPYAFDLFVTMVEDHKEIVADILKNFPEARIEIVANRGYDVAPFVHILRSVCLDDYSLVVKVHTKRDMPTGSLLGTVNVGGNRWRQYALSFLKTPQVFDKCVKAFDCNSKLGMVANAHLILKKDTNAESADKAADMLNDLEITKTSRTSFVAGTMFMVRASIMAPLQSLKADMADIPDDRHQQMGVAHAMERLFGGLVWAQGYEIADVYSSFPMTGHFWDILRKVSMFFFKRKVDKNGRYTIRICRIPVYSRKLSV